MLNQGWKFVLSHGSTTPDKQRDYRSVIVSIRAATWRKPAQFFHIHSTHFLDLPQVLAAAASVIVFGMALSPFAKILSILGR